MPEVTKPKLSKSHRAALQQAADVARLLEHPSTYLIEVQPLKKNGQPKGHTVIAVSSANLSSYTDAPGVSVVALLITKNTYENGNPRYRRVTDGA